MGQPGFRGMVGDKGRDGFPGKDGDVRKVEVLSGGRIFLRHVINLGPAVTGCLESDDEKSLKQRRDRFERDGWIRARWEQPPQGKKRKVYSLTADGKKVQRARTEEWLRFTAAVRSILKECGHA